MEVFQLPLRQFGIFLIQIFQVFDPLLILRCVPSLLRSAYSPPRGLVKPRTSSFSS